jgi:TrkA domain protein
MTDVNEVNLPGVGVMHEFVTNAKNRVAVISHRSGGKEIVIGDREDPDASRSILKLGEQDARTLAELLGGSRVTEALAELQQRVEGLAIDWLPVRSDSPYVDRTIADAQVRSRTGVSIVAVLRGEEPFAAPGPDFTFASGDYLVVVGTARGIEGVVDLLHNG